jgi:hypothetical protein
MDVSNEAFRIDSKGNLVITGNFAFAQGNYLNAPAEATLKENFITYLDLQYEPLTEQQIINICGGEDGNG